MALIVRPDHSTRRHILACFGTLGWEEIANFKISNFFQEYRNILVNTPVECPLDQSNDSLCLALTRFGRRSRKGHFCHFLRIRNLIDYRRLSAFVNITRLEVIFTHNLDDYSISSILKKCTNCLRHLRLATDQTMDELEEMMVSLNECFLLRTLTLEFLNETPLPQLAGNLPRIENLLTFDFRLANFDNTLLCALGQLIPGLEGFKIGLNCVRSMSQYKIDLLQSNHFNNQLAKSVDELPDICPEEITTLENFFVKFCNLSSLTIDFSYLSSNLAQVINYLQPLAVPLRRLKLHRIPANFFNSTQPVQPLYSLESLSIQFNFGFAGNHQWLIGFPWDQGFPSMNKFTLLNIPSLCEICQAGRKVEHCKELYVANMRTLCPNLQTVEVP